MRTRKIDAVGGRHRECAIFLWNAQKQEQPTGDSFTGTMTMEELLDPRQRLADPGQAKRMARS
jgi:hypothetical protein